MPFCLRNRGFLNFEIYLSSGTYPGIWGGASTFMTFGTRPHSRFLNVYCQEFNSKDIAETIYIHIYMFFFVDRDN